LSVELLGIRLLGFSSVAGHKLLLTLGLILVVVLLRAVTSALIGRVNLVDGRDSRFRFWARQALSLVIAAILVIGIVSIWFDNPANLTTAVGLVTAGLAFALQKVVTSLAAYFIILRGTTFTVGDRITMGGVRGDVVGLGFFQTTIMEMGQPPSVQGADPAVWVMSRQFTGRIVTVANSKIFDEPVYNYTRDFPFIWEEMRLPIAYRDDRTRAEAILLESARQHAVDPSSLDAAMLERLERNFRVSRADFEPRVFWRLTDNWLELTVRFITRDHGVRSIKDAMSRDVLARLEAENIAIASSSIEISRLPELKASISP
jgi:small-conductance mechanosensitive channel